VPTPVATPVPTQRTYVVQEGDTLAAIAQQFGTTVEALQTANGIEDPDEIVIGQVLVIP
jgi:LysM repeat protein